VSVKTKVSQEKKLQLRKQRDLLVLQSCAAGLLAAVQPIPNSDLGQLTYRLSSSRFKVIFLSLSR
jgi:hypothetical protein